MIGVETRTSGTKNVGDKVSRGVNKYMRDGAAKGFAVAQENTPEDRGQLRQSGFPPEERDGQFVWGYAGAAYAAAQEEGADPFTPPIQPLLEWADRVFGSTPISTQEVLKRVDNNEWGPDLFAHPGMAVWSKIRSEGIQPKGFMQDGADAQRQWYKNNDVRTYIDRELER